MKIYHLHVAIIFIILSSCQQPNPKLPNSSLPQHIETDICVNGATSSGIMAALAVKKEGKTVTLLNPVDG